MITVSLAKLYKGFSYWIPTLKCEVCSRVWSKEVTASFISTGQSWLPALYYAANALEGIEGNIGDVSNKIDLVMAANTKGFQEIHNNNYQSCVDGNDIAKKVQW